MADSAQNKTFPLFPAGGRPLVLAVTSRSLFKDEGEYWEHVRRVAESGANGFVLREKDLASDQYRRFAQTFLEICSDSPITPILHTNVEVARELGCEAIQLPIPQLKLIMTYQSILESGSVASGDRAVSLMPQDAPMPLDGMHEYFPTIGASTHSVEEARYAQGLGISYVTLSHIYETSCKPGLEPRGLGLIDDVRAACPDLAVIALGGIDAGNAAAAIEHGADGVALMSGLMLAEDPRSIVESIQSV